MVADASTAAKAVLAPVRAAMYDWTEDGVQAALDAAFRPDAAVRLAFPFEDLDGPTGLYGDALGPLATAMPNLERRDFIVMSGPDGEGAQWVGCAGHYVGTWMAPFLGMPATGQVAAMRYHEFFRVEDGQIAEMQALWDLPALMMQAGVWPMGPALGRELMAPAPASQDGLVAGPWDEARSHRSYQIVLDMLIDMGKHPAEPVEAMNLERYWHPRFNWYGPAGIGTSRAIAGFRNNHQIPFLKALPDRNGGTASNKSHFFGDGDYVGVTAWPGMSMSVTGDGWLGIVPTGQAITMRSLDFWRVEGDLIRENWVLVDLLHTWDQLGVDVLARMREVARRPG